MTPHPLPSAVSREVAYVSHATEAEVNRLVDEDLLPHVFLETDTRRKFDLLGASVILVINRMTKDFLTKSARRTAFHYFAVHDFQIVSANIHRHIDVKHYAPASPIDTEFTLHLANRVDELIGDEPRLVVDFKDELQGIVDRFTCLYEASRTISTDPDVMGGMPVFKGTRVPIETVLASVDAGVSFETMQEDYPFLTQEMIDLARVYLVTHPRRGRPKKPGERPRAKLLRTEELPAKRAKP